MKPVRVYIGLGSNLDDPRAQVQAAIAALAGLDGCTLQACSSLYRSAPQEMADQPEFMNAVCRLRCERSAWALHEELLRIEQAAGRRREAPRFGPRRLDLDLLLYGDQTIHTSRLIVPHPRLHRRAFVLYPLRELDPQIEIPGYGHIAALVEQCANQDIARIQRSPTWMRPAVRR